MIKKADAVFEGGGVKGIGLVGAISVVEAQGYEWGNLAGTSAGAIVASLAAAGYKSAELKQIVGSVDYNRFMDKKGLDKIPFIGPILSIFAKKGIYQGDYFENWIRELLAAKGVKKFGDLVIPGEADPRYKYKLNVITSDISKETLAVMPNALTQYDMDPDQFDVARAVRMSMSIPFFFEPIVMNQSYFVDGGILSNFPLWLFDSKNDPDWPTFGFKLIEPEYGKPNEVRNPVDFLKAIAGTMMDAHDNLHVEKEDFDRTIAIPTMGVGTTEFNLSNERRDALYQSGVDAGHEFFKYFDFDTYVANARKRREAEYQERIQKKKLDVIGKNGES